MPKEMDLFFEEVAFNNGTFKDIFTSNVGFVNKDTAAIYGLDPAPLHGRHDQGHPGRGTAPRAS